MKYCWPDGAKMKGNYFKNFDDCDLKSHAILSVDNLIINDESQKLRGEFNQGIKLIL